MFENVTISFSCFNAHAMISIFHIFMNVNKLLKPTKRRKTTTKTKQQKQTAHAYTETSLSEIRTRNATPRRQGPLHQLEIKLTARWAEHTERYCVEIARNFKRHGAATDVSVQAFEAISPNRQFQAARRSARV